ncbi:PTS sugar transporter subunit IIA [Mycoplasma sp. Ms02]|uniref:PTS sugar transporter subunit IIA n=1 Tax=Mycoplasma sp. Ms02 TaxID=353851 RepID=UPI001C89A588|nr:PTS sugar transporter subunit IIA [Mycoplasma sp. Ms02]QZE12497.1 PTS sugar transporter subunit IIA [Mycoplasma sp. Ms02]
MSNLFKADLVEYRSDLKDWKEVVKAGVKMLVDKNLATDELANAIFESTSQYGAYYVLEKGIALLHAAPGPYTLGVGTGTIILDSPVIFNDQADKEAQIIVTLSSTDAHSHLELLQEFSHYFTIEEFKQKAYQVKSKQEFLELVKIYQPKE